MDLSEITRMLDDTPMDKVGEVVDFFMDHRAELDKLIAAVQAAPALIGKLADALDDAGEHAKDAAQSIAGPVPVARAAPLRRSCRAQERSGNVGDQLAEAADFLDDMAAFMASIEVPDIEPTYAEVAGVNIVSGLDVGKEACSPTLRCGCTPPRTTLGKAKGDLAGLAENLESLADILASVGARSINSGTGSRTRACRPPNCSTRRTAPERRRASRNGGDGARSHRRAAPPRCARPPEATLTPSRHEPGSSHVSSS